MANTGIRKEGMPNNLRVILSAPDFLPDELKDIHEDITMKGKRDGIMVLSHRFSPSDAAALILSL